LLSLVRCDYLGVLIVDLSVFKVNCDDLSFNVVSDYSVSTYITEFLATSLGFISLLLRQFSESSD